MCYVLQSLHNYPHSTPPHVQAASSWGCFLIPQNQAPLILLATERRLGLLLPSSRLLGAPPPSITSPIFTNAVTSIPLHQVAERREPQREAEVTLGFKGCPGHPLRSTNPFPSTARFIPCHAVTTQDGLAKGIDVGVIVSKPGGVCFEIGIEGLFASAHGEAAWSRHRSQMLDFNPKPANSEGKPVIPHTFGTLSSMEFSHGLTETDLCPSSATHVKKGLTKLQKATTKVLGKTRFQMPSPGFGKQLDELALELHFPLELNKGIQCHGILTDRCEEVNKIDGVSQISIDKEQGNVMVSGLMDSDSIVKKPNNKDANSQLKKLHPTRGAKGQPKDAGANDQKNGLCSKDAKTVLPQPTVQQPQQTQIKQLKAPQQPKLISPKEPFAVAVPVKKGPKSVEFNAPDVDTDDDSMFYGLSNIDDIPEEDSGEEHSIFDVFFENFDGLTLLDTNNAEEGFKTDGFSEPKMITKPLAMPLGANNGGDNNGANGGSEIQAQIKGNGNNAVKRVSSAKQNRGSCGGGRQMQNVNDVALGVMVGLAGFPGTCQTGGGSVDRPHTSSVQHGSGGVFGAAMGMPVRGMPASPGFYQQGGAAASTSIPTGQAMLQDAVAARKTMAARQQHMAPAQQQQQPEVSRSKKMQ